MKKFKFYDPKPFVFFEKKPFKFSNIEIDDLLLLYYLPEDRKEEWLKEIERIKEINKKNI